MKFTQYTDAFDRIRREVADTAGLRLTTRYTYDLLGRLKKVISPKGDTTKYWYDAFGRVSYKAHPDAGGISYGYDAVGNIRFSRDEEQAGASRLAFHQYDDMNRLTVIGEAFVNPNGECAEYCEDDPTNY